MRRRDYIGSFTFLCLLLSLLFVLKATPVFASTSASDTNSEQATTEQEEQPVEPILEPTYDEPAGSDLTLLHGATLLDAPRWVQSFARDSKYYYYVQMTDAEKGNLRITRVRYGSAGVILSQDHMDLNGFGHGTNMDVSVYNGRTYIWIGSGMNKNGYTTSISCFPYAKNKIYNKKAGNTTKIRIKGSLKYASNVFPAVDVNNKYVVVRYTYKGKQYFQKYKIYNGNKIKGYYPSSKIAVAKTAGDFQGFDVSGNYIYTIEGSPSLLFLSGYDKTRKFQSTIVRRINMRNGSKKTKAINGAKSLTFREPEGIKILKNNRREMMFVSNTLTLMLCNIYKIKSF